MEFIPDYLLCYIESDLAKCEDVVLYTGQNRCDIGIVAILGLIMFFSHLRDSKSANIEPGSSWVEV